MSGRASDKLVLGGEPRVQLLPQSVRDREKAAKTRRRLAMLVVLSLVLVGGAYGFAWMRNDLAQRQLIDAQAQTQAILADQSTYAEGTRAAALVDGIRSAQTYLTGNEVMWENVLMKVAGMMPAGTDFGTTIAVGQAPWEPALIVEGPLRTSRMAIITISFTSPTVLDPASVVPQLSTLPGYVDSRFDSSIWDENYLHYATTVRVMFDTGAVSERFAVPADDTDEDAADTTTTEDEQ